MVEPGEIVGLYSRLEAAVVVLAFEARVVGGAPRSTRRPSRSRRSPRRRSPGRASPSRRPTGRSATGSTVAARTSTLRTATGTSNTASSGSLAAPAPRRGRAMRPASRAAAARDASGAPNRGRRHAGWLIGAPEPGSAAGIARWVAVRTLQRSTSSAAVVWRTGCANPVVSPSEVPAWIILRWRLEQVRWTGPSDGSMATSRVRVRTSTRHGDGRTQPCRSGRCLSGGPFDGGPDGVRKHPGAEPAVVGRHGGCSGAGTPPTGLSGRRCDPGSWPAATDRAFPGETARGHALEDGGAAPDRGRFAGLGRRHPWDWLERCRGGGDGAR